MKQYLYLLLLLVITASSCNTAYKNSQYFVGLDRNSALSHKIDNYAPLTIQSGDILAIHVRSLSPEGSAIFNTDDVSSASSGTTTGGATSGGGGTPVSGYLVDKNGDIQLPLIHGVKVSGLTLEEIQVVLQKDITPFLKEPIVTVHLQNFKITVIGDVGRPDVFSIPHDHISIPEVLAMAGDLSISGKRQNILLVREINGERKYVNIDMTSDKLFNSPYFYLKNNDLLYVEAGRGKFVPLDQTRTNLSIALSLISLLLVVFSVGKNNKIF